MSIEAYWYQCYDADGNPPKCRRLSRLPAHVTWEAAIDFAIGYASGRAGYRSIGRNSVTGETTWWCPDFQPERRSAKSAVSEWWLIPYRVERRIFALYQAAIECEIIRGRGTAAGDAIASRLRTWKRTGHWQKVAATVVEGQRRGKITPTGKRRKRRKATA
jgi:hypothetical protein